MMRYVPSMRDVIQIVESVSVDNPLGYVFHGTGMEYLPSIREQGLLPQPPPDYCWPEFDEMIEDSDDDEPELPPEAFEPRVFAAETIKGVNDYAENHATPAILRIAVTDYAEWDEGETDHPYLFTTKPVPPEKIEVWQNGKWVPLRSLA